MDRAFLAKLILVVVAAFVGTATITAEVYIWTHPRCQDCGTRTNSYVLWGNNKPMCLLCANKIVSRVLARKYLD